MRVGRTAGGRMTRGCTSDAGASGRDVRARGSSGRRLRKVLRDRSGIILGPTVHDALSARMVDENGSFDLCFQGGFGTSAAMLAAPDIGLASMSEVVRATENIMEALAGSDLCVVVDGDDGHGGGGWNNVQRTTRLMSRSSAAGMLIEDQKSPKGCGHFDSRVVIGREAARLRIRAAVDAAREGTEDSEDAMLIFGRSDARQALSLDEALFRVEMFADEGAEVLFIDALQDKDELRALCKRVPDVPKMTTYLGVEGGKTPWISPMELEDLGFAICAYPLTLLSASMRAMDDALAAIASGRNITPRKLMTFSEVKSIVRYGRYAEAAERYKSAEEEVAHTATAGNQTAENESDDDDEEAVVTVVPEHERPVEGRPATSGLGSVEGGGDEGGRSRKNWYDRGTTTSNVEIVSTSNFSGASGGRTENTTTTGFAGRLPGQGDAVFGPQISVSIFNTATGKVELEFKLPIAFLSRTSRMVPKVAGLDLESMIESAVQNSGGSKGAEGADVVLLDVEESGYRVKIVLEA